MPPPKGTQTEILEAALIGLELRRNEVDRKIAEIRVLLRREETPTGRTQSAPSRVLSAAARRRISAAQKKRWAEVRKAKKAKETQSAKSVSRGKRTARKKSAPKPGAASAAAPESQSVE